MPTSGLYKCAYPRLGSKAFLSQAWGRIVVCEDVPMSVGCSSYPPSCSNPAAGLHSLTHS